MIADYVGDGSVPYFVEMMNERAQELGMSGTKFTSPHGLPDPESHTTARDMALLARHALSLPGFEALMTATTYDGGPTNINEHLNWNTTNRLMVSSSPYYNSAVSGIKTGYHHTLGSYAGHSGQKKRLQLSRRPDGEPRRRHPERQRRLLGV